jgi:hypothetical protein
MTGSYVPRCSIFDTISASDGDAARQTQPHGQGNPTGSIQSASPHIHSATVTGFGKSAGDIKVRVNRKNGNSVTIEK